MVQACLAAVGVVAAVLIAYWVQRASSRIGAESNRITTDIRGHTDLIHQLVEASRESLRRGRLDELYRSLQEIRDPELLDKYLSEGREIANNLSERVFLEKYYFSNPAVPLLTLEMLQDRAVPEALSEAVVGGVVDHLPSRYSSLKNLESAFSIRKELGKFLQLCYRVDSDHASAENYPLTLERCFSYLRTIWREGWELNVFNAKPLLDPWEPGIAKHFLYMIQCDDDDKKLFVSVLTAVSWHIHDDVRPWGRALDNDSHDMLQAYADLIHAGGIKDIGMWPRGEGWEDSTLQCIGSTVFAVALLASTDGKHESHAGYITRNLIEDLTDALKSFDGHGMSRITTGMSELSNGVRILKSNRYESSLFDPLSDAADILLEKSHLRENRDLSLGKLQKVPDALN
ncbi:hypothetical protein D2E29_02495 [Mycobacteroides abscessus]|nr:hypothetical protein D2E32_12025 [Mycobacteroides abscessus]RIR13445.1 hypothetical protein D2E29_02495 [Mycobacteroides abscessus]RIS27400.1 hypothetical protein D2E56_07835 [Mycobacteroides abscessus]RIT75861.1 hypothetical protein D2E77_06375 [Mycobacteroides abscessus]RIT81948.1 hypothetical protein D2E91_08895 [Mycobacteroides abscessus]